MGGVMLQQKVFSPHPVATKLPATWIAPDTAQLDHSDSATLIRYGRTLVVNTAVYLGPAGSVAKMSNGMNCQNCHLNAGTRAFTGNFALVASEYPKFKARSNRMESIEFRINDCMTRSLNGQPLDSLSPEMKAMVAYIKWVGSGIAKGSRPAGTQTEELPLLPRAASVENGQVIYMNKCKTCHGANGEGLRSDDSTHFIYPPLWGAHSYNVSAGMYRISKLAAFIKQNMPYKPVPAPPELTNEQAWDVAAFVLSRPRPQKFFEYDWPNIIGKPFDYPFGPYADSFSLQQHKYGPFIQVKKAIEAAQKKAAATAAGGFK